MSTQLEDDIGTILGLVRELRTDVSALPTRADLDATEGRILKKLRGFGTTVGGDVGALLQRYEELYRRVVALEDAPSKANGQPERPRPARVR